MNLKQRILLNQFANDIRDLQISRESYAELCLAIKELSAEWKGRTAIDKELVAHLYGAVRVTEYAAVRLKEWGDERAPEVAEMAHELDGLLLECFGSGLT